MLSLQAIQEEILTELETQFVEEVYEIAIPNSTTLKKSGAGRFQPYITIQFGDLQQGINRNMASTRNDDYYMPVYIQFVAHEAKTARQLYNKCIDKMLSFKPKYASEMTKRPGGSMFPVVSDTGATEAYLFACSFSVTVQILTVPA